MNEALVLDMVREAVTEIIIVSAPMLLVALLIGLVVSIFQTVTSIQEQTLAFVPKIVAVFVSLLLFGPWMMTRLVAMIEHMYGQFGSLIAG